MRIGRVDPGGGAAGDRLVLLADPENYLRFMSGITHWEVVGQKPNGLGARYRILVRVGAAEVGGLVEMVEWNEPFDIAWHSVTGVDHRGRWRDPRAGRGPQQGRVPLRLRRRRRRRRGMVMQLGAALIVRRQMRRTLQQLKRQVEQEQRRLEAERRRAARQTARA